MMHRFTGETSESATGKSLNVNQETFDNVNEVACVKEEPPALLPDDEVDAGPLTIVKSETTDVREKEPKIEGSDADGHPSKSTKDRWNKEQYAKSTELKYGCPNCPKTFDKRIDRMLHKQIHSFEAIPRITDTSGFRCIDLNAGISVASSELQVSHQMTTERHERRNIYEQGNEGNRTDMQENNAAEGDVPEVENGSSIQNATADSIEGPKPFICIICKIPFSTKGEMVSHRQITHEIQENSEETVNATSDSVNMEPSPTEIADNGIAHMNDDIRPSENPEALGGLKAFSANNGLVVGQKPVDKKKKRRHSPKEIENVLDNSMTQALPKKSRKQGSDLSDHVLTETQYEPSHVFEDVGGPPSTPQDYTSLFPQNENIADHLVVDRHSQKIRFRRSSAEHIIEKDAKKHPKTFYLVWSEMFSADLAASVALNGSNCILCVKNFDPSSLPDVLSLSPNFSLQTATVNFGSAKVPVYFFNFGEMNLPLSRPSFKSYKKIESSLKKFVRLEGMKLKNVIKYSKKENSWYDVLMQQLKEDCVVASKV